VGIQNAGLFTAKSAKIFSVAFYKNAKFAKLYLFNLVKWQSHKENKNFAASRLCEIIRHQLLKKLCELGVNLSALCG